MKNRLRIKILGRIISNQVIKYLDKYELSFEIQYGLRKVMRRKMHSSN